MAEKVTSQPRITPAYAGKSLLCSSVFVFREDHPRLRGEKAFMGWYAACCWGSPPLTRGKVSASCYFSPLLRITPAYAGKSRFSANLETAISGSPPLTRGKAVTGEIVEGILGITPAYAGKRKKKTFTMPFTRDHPRLRGEKLLCLKRSSKHGGSPPLTRGKAWIFELYLYG